MPWTFNQPPVDDVDRVRLLVGESEQDGLSLEDETIEFILAEESDDLDRTAVRVLDFMLAKLGRQPSSRTVVGLTVQRTLSDLTLVRDRIQARVNAGGGGIGIFGLTYSDRDTIEDDTDFRRPFGGEGRDING